MKSKGCFISIFINIFVFIFSICILLLYIYSDWSIESTSTSFQFISELGNNWSKGPYIDISSSSDDTCKKDEILFLSDSYWQGTVEGCLCGDTLTRGICKRPASNICKTIGERENIPLKIFQKRKR